MSTSVFAARLLNWALPVFLQEGEKLVKKIGGVFAFKVKDGPGGKEATWVVDVKNGNGSLTTDSGTLFWSGCRRSEGSHQKWSFLFT